MHTTRRAIWYLAILLTLAFPTLATGAFAVAACNGMGQAASMPRACCITDPAPCACHARRNDTPRRAAHAGSCHVSDCQCAFAPSPEQAPASHVIVAPLFLAFLAVTPQFAFPSVSQRGLPIADARQSSHSISRASSSPRAPPFQG